jgi:hypothetical protein
MPITFLNGYCCQNFYVHFCIDSRIPGFKLAHVFASHCLKNVYVPQTPGYVCLTYVLTAYCFKFSF